MTKSRVSFFYIKQTRTVRFLIGDDIHNFVFLANAEHTLKGTWQ
jgi:hypothetical protein